MDIWLKPEAFSKSRGFGARVHLDIFPFIKDYAGVPFRCRRNSIRSADGYSLMELLLVAALAIGVAAVAVPRLIQFRRAYNLQSNLRLVQVMIHTARYDAISQGIQYQLIFQSTPTPQFQLQRNTGTPLAPNFVNVGAPVPMAKNVQFAKGGKILCDANGVVTATGFDISPTEGEPFVALSNGTKSFYIYVSRVGRVRVVKNS